MQTTNSPQSHVLGSGELQVKGVYVDDRQMSHQAPRLLDSNSDSGSGFGSDYDSGCGCGSVATGGGCVCVCVWNEVCRVVVSACLAVIVCLFICSLCFRACFTSPSSVTNNNNSNKNTRRESTLNNVRSYIVASGKRSQRRRSREGRQAGSFFGSLPSWQVVPNNNNNSNVTSQFASNPLAKGQPRQGDGVERGKGVVGFLFSPMSLTIKPLVNQPFFSGSFFSPEHSSIRQELITQLVRVWRHLQLVSSVEFQFRQKLQFSGEKRHTKNPR